MPQRLFAYVWPAIALDPRRLLETALAVGDELSVSLQALQAVAVSPLGGTPGHSASGGVAGLSAHSGISNPAATPSGEAPSENEIAFLVAALLFVTAMAMLAFTVRRELRAMYRWPL